MEERCTKHGPQNITAAHILKGSWALEAVPCCSATGLDPAREESYKQTRGDSELTGGFCPGKRKTKSSRSPETFALSSGLLALPGLLIMFFQYTRESLVAHDMGPKSAFKRPPEAAAQNITLVCIWVNQHHAVLNIEEGSFWKLIFILRT